ncbi:MAG: VCBS repeat-containing protein [Flavobacteriaceae bacterium]
MVRSYLLFGFILLFFLSCKDKKDSFAQHEEPEKVIQYYRAISADSSGIQFLNKTQESQNFNYLNYPFIYFGGGVSTGDINNDGLPDIYFTGQMGKNKLYLNKGNMSFQDITSTAGVEGTYNHWTTGTTMADVNNDGFLDIYVSVAGPGSTRKNLLYINNKNNTFSEQAQNYGIADVGHTIQSAFFDYDNDGDLDLYVGNYPTSGFSQNNNFFEKRMKHPTIEESDKLYRNDDGKFIDVTLASGILNYGLTLGVSFSDFNNDGNVDIYVSNDFNSSDFLYINQGNGTFLNQLQQYTRHTSNFGMGTDAADINNDGLIDFVQLDMMGSTNEDQKSNMSAMNTALFYDLVDKGLHHQYMKNTLQLNTGLNSFIDIGEMAGISYTDWSWCPLLFDMQNNGFKDLFVTNGMRRNVNNNDYNAFFRIQKAYGKVKPEQYLDWVRRMSSTPVPNFAFSNNGDLTFEKKTKEYGLSVEGFSNGASYADLDLDGDLDLVVNHLDKTSQIFENKINNKTGANYLRVKLIGKEDNTFGIGCKIKIFTNGDKQLVELQTTRGYESSVEPIVHFGVGNLQKIDSVQIFWPMRGLQTVYNIEANQLLEIKQEEGAKVQAIKKDKPKRLFSSLELNLSPKYTHRENDFNDFQREVLLPHKMSQQGPALAVADVNGDGLDDFYVGGAKNQSGQLYVQNEQGGFEATAEDIWKSDKEYEDVSATFLDVDNDGDNDLYVASGGNENPDGDSLYQDRLYINDGTGKFKRVKKGLPKIYTSSSIAKAFDFDKDGDLDLFVGGRQTPGKYPLATNSYILRNDSKKTLVKFTDITNEIAPDFSNLGMVTDAEWADINKDGEQDLIIVGEWMAPKIFINTEGRFLDESSSYGLNDFVGWWNTVKMEDLDNDGDLDFLAGNLGLNYKYKATETEPFKIYAKDFDDNGSLDIVLGYYNAGELYPLRGRECSSQQIPSIKKKFPDYNSFSKANLTQVYTPTKLNEALSYEAKTFANSVFMNESGTFIQKPLPYLAQTSSINDILIEDIDNDGNLDIVVAGNLYASEVETPRNDASYGLLLTGLGGGEFKVVSPMESGINISGELKNIRKINTINDGTYYLIARNNMPLLILKKQNNSNL